MTWAVMDCRKLDYPEATFDFIIDKTTVDALLCGKKAALNVARYLAEAYRVLKPACYYILVSYARPALRLKHLQRQHVRWEITEEIVKRNKTEYFVYICKKLPEPAASWDQIVAEIRIEDEAAGVAEESDDFD